MYFNVKKGLDQLFLAQILEIVVAVCGLLISVVGWFAVVAWFIGGSVLATLLTVLTVIVAIGFFGGTIAAFVLGLLGILDAKKDEISYNNALVWLCAGIVASLIIGIFDVFVKTNGFFFGLIRVLFGAASIFADFMVMYSVINSTVNVANAIGNIEVVNIGTARAQNFKIFCVVSIVLNILSVLRYAQIHVFPMNFFDKLLIGIFGVLRFIGGVSSLAAAVVGLVIFFQYLGFLSKARNMV